MGKGSLKSKYLIRNCKRQLPQVELHQLKIKDK